MDKKENVCMQTLCSEYRKTTTEYVECQPTSKYHQSIGCVKCGCPFFRTDESDGLSSNNFKCPETGKEFFISNYSTSFKGTDKSYFDKWKKPLVNPENDVLLIPIERDRGFGSNVIGKFNTGTLDGRKRINDHFAARVKSKSSETKEIKDSKLKEFKDANLGK